MVRHAAFALVVLSTTLSVPALAQDWNIDVVSVPTYGLGHISMALDGCDLILVAWSGMPENPSDTTGMASFDGSGWVQHTPPWGTAVATFSSVALSKSRVPCIAYHDLASHSLKYASHDGMTWVRETVAQGSISEDLLGASLVLTADGMPCIAYAQTFELFPQWLVYPVVRFARFDGSSWQTAFVDSGFLAADRSLVLDSSGSPHIAYIGGNNHEELKYATLNGTNWTSRTVASGAIESLSLVLDSQGTPCISYATDESVQFAKQQGTDWHIEMVDSGTRQVSLGIGQDNIPRVAYRQGPDRLMYAARQTTNWATSHVDTQLYLSDACLCLTPSDAPRIAYGSFGTPANIFVRVASHDLPELWSGAQSLGSDWWTLPWFGVFAIDCVWHPWIYHQQHGWMYPVGEDTMGIWFYTLDMEWLWTNEEVYPNFYSYGGSNWYYYVIGTSDPRIFYNWTTGEWEEH